MGPKGRRRLDGRLPPTASLSFGEDFRPHALTRSGREELADDLSKGTQEQLAVLTRLAFADLLLAKGKPASLVLDDALVFADDDRFETMTEILTEAGQRMQVIVLSCRVSAYRRHREMVADEPAGEAREDRREASRTRALHDLPDGGGRRAARSVPAHSANDRRASTWANSAMLSQAATPHAGSHGRTASDDR